MEQQAFRKKLDRLWERGGKVSLACGRYEIEQSICVNTPCIRIDGESWSYSSDPNGVFESKYGTKLRLTKDIPAITVGLDYPVEGLLFHNFGVQGNIEGIDTRDFLKVLTPSGGTGLHFAHTRMDKRK